VGLDEACASSRLTTFQTPWGWYQQLPRQLPGTSTPRQTNKNVTTDVDPAPATQDSKQRAWKDD
jgi:hypothetical protein